MTTTDRDSVERTLIDDELRRITFQRLGAMEKINLIKQLYRTSSMTSAERDAALRQLY